MNDEWMLDIFVDRAAMLDYLYALQTALENSAEEDVPLPPLVLAWMANIIRHSHPDKEVAAFLPAIILSEARDDVDLAALSD